MNVDPKTNKGDIIASVYAKPGTFAEIVQRFGNVSQYAVFLISCHLLKNWRMMGIYASVKTGWYMPAKRESNT